MGLFDFFGGSKDDQKSIDKIKRRLTDQFRQTHERYEAMDQLVKIGTPAALEALLDRFTLRVSGPTVDEPLQRYIQTHDAVYFPLKSLREIAGDEVAVTTLLEVIQNADPGYHDGLERLREIVSNLRDFRHEKVREALAGLLKSRNNEIRFYALDGLVGYPAEQVAPLFAQVLLDPEETARVKGLAYELAVEHQLPLQTWAAQLATMLPSNYRMDSQGVMQRAGA
jgi:HEAT repeat protein